MKLNVTIVSFNSYVRSVNAVSCELFTRDNYKNSSVLRLDINKDSSTFYFAVLSSITTIRI